MGTGTAAVQYQVGDDFAVVTIEMRIPVQRRELNAVILAPHVPEMKRALAQAIADAPASLRSSAVPALLDEYAKYWLWEKVGLEQVPLILEPDGPNQTFCEKEASNDHGRQGDCDCGNCSPVCRPGR